MKYAPIGICEMVAQTPAEFPNARPIGPCRQYGMGQVSITDNIGKHAEALLERIEDELIHKYHLEHICDYEGRSPYKGRSQGFKLKKLQMGNQMKSTEDASLLIKKHTNRPCRASNRLAL